MIGPVLALAVLVGSALLAVLLHRRSRLATAIAATGAIAAAVLAMPALLAVLLGGEPRGVQLAWAEPVGRITLAVDPLTAFFAIPLLVLAAVCAVYGGFYLDDERTHRKVAIPAAIFNLMVAAMLVVVLARDAVSFLFAWEVMTLASYLLVTFEHQHADTRRAGWVYLLAGHVGVVAILALFLALGQHGGGLQFAGWSAARAGGATAAGLLALAVLGFGVKAGLAPLHIWLPEAHAAAPSHVSALMSGMLIKLGVYGVLRTLTFLAPAAWWGPVLAVLGAVTALLGIGLALYQRDLKRALAYSSVENVGVIVLGLGVGHAALAAGHPTAAALAWSGALLHVWHHAAMKGLLFLGAGAVVHATGTRDLEQLGGVLRRMPRVGSLLVLGAVAIAALPPLAGFASEWLIYRGLLEGVVHGSTGGVVGSVLAITTLIVVGALAGVCFVRLIGVALLGQPRSLAAATAHEASLGLLAPMAVLAAAVVVLPLVGFVVVRGLGPVLAQVAGQPLDLAPAIAALRPLAVVGAVVWAAILLGLLALAVRVRRPRADDTWGCGYAAPTARMQYTARSFAETSAGFLPRWLRPRLARVRNDGLFPSAGSLVADTRDPLTRGFYEPFLDRWALRFARLRWVQQGVLQLYVLYILIAVVLALTLVAVDGQWGLP